MIRPTSTMVAQMFVIRDLTYLVFGIEALLSFLPSCLSVTSLLSV